MAATRFPFPSMLTATPVSEIPLKLVTKKSAVNMAKAIEKLNNHPLVKKYNEALVEYNLLIDRIERIIFDF